MCYVSARGEITKKCEQSLQWKLRRESASENAPAVKWKLREYLFLYTEGTFSLVGEACDFHFAFMDSFTFRHSLKKVVDEYCFTCYIDIAKQ